MARKKNAREFLAILDEFVEANCSHPDYDRAKDAIQGLNTIIDDTEAHAADLVLLYFRQKPGCSDFPVG